MSSLSPQTTKQANAAWIPNGARPIGSKNNPRSSPKSGGSFFGSTSKLPFAGRMASNKEKAPHPALNPKENVYPGPSYEEEDDDESDHDDPQEGDSYESDPKDDDDEGEDGDNRGSYTQEYDNDYTRSGFDSKKPPSRGKTEQYITFLKTNAVLGNRNKKNIIQTTEIVLTWEFDPTTVTTNRLIQTKSIYIGEALRPDIESDPDTRILTTDHKYVDNKKSWLLSVMKLDSFSNADVPYVVSLAKADPAKPFNAYTNEYKVYNTKRLMNGLVPFGFTIISPGTSETVTLCYDGRPAVFSGVNRCFGGHNIDDLDREIRWTKDMKNGIIAEGSIIDDIIHGPLCLNQNLPNLSDSKGGFVRVGNTSITAAKGWLTNLEEFIPLFDQTAAQFVLSRLDGQNFNYERGNAVEGTGKKTIISTTLRLTVQYDYMRKNDARAGEIPVSQKISHRADVAEMSKKMKAGLIPL